MSRPLLSGRRRRPSRANEALVLAPLSRLRRDWEDCLLGEPDAGDTVHFLYDDAIAVLGCDPERCSISGAPDTGVTDVGAHYRLRFEDLTVLVYIPDGYAEELRNRRRLGISLGSSPLSWVEMLERIASLAGIESPKISFAVEDDADGYRLALEQIVRHHEMPSGESWEEAYNEVCSIAKDAIERSRR